MENLHIDVLKIVLPRLFDDDGIAYRFPLFPTHVSVHSTSVARRDYSMRESKSRTRTHVIESLTTRFSCCNDEAREVTL